MKARMFSEDPSVAANIADQRAHRDWKVDAAMKKFHYDEMLVAEIARMLDEDAGFVATSENTGGWNYCVLMPDARTGGTWYWGMANECWGASLMADDGDCVGSLETTVPSNCADPGRIALAICRAMLDSDK